MEIIITKHAKFEADRRHIPLEIVEEVALSPQQIIESRMGRKICQSRLMNGILLREMLFRVIVKDDNDTRHVITVYKTSQFEKYWEDID